MCHENIRLFFTSDAIQYGHGVRGAIMLRFALGSRFKMVPGNFLPFLPHNVAEHFAYRYFVSKQCIPMSNHVHHAKQSQPSLRWPPYIPLSVCQMRCSTVAKSIIDELALIPHDLSRFLSTYFQAIGLELAKVLAVLNGHNLPIEHSVILRFKPMLQDIRSSK